VTDVPPAVFTDFADIEARGVSPLYERLARAIATRPGLRHMLGAAPAGQRRGTLFFAAVHDLVLERDDSYPRDGPSLEAFCRANEAAITERIASRRTQTNEVARSAQLVPGLAIVAALAGHPPSLLEVGASAGLNLRFDDYRYTYRSVDGTSEVGDARAPVHIECTFDGAARALPRELPVVGVRIGLDSEPIDLEDPVQVRWLRACVWADEMDRDRRLQAAIELARADPPNVIRGDAVADLEMAAARLPIEVPLVVVHQAVMGYLSIQARTSFRRAIRDLARQRPVYWLFAESPAAAEVLAGVVPPPSGGRAKHLLVLADLTRDTPTSMVLAEADPHGSWLRWMAPARS
jgi:hypothetical protein